MIYIFRVPLICMVALFQVDHWIFAGNLGLKIGHSQTCWLITVFPIKIDICGYAWVRVSMHGYAPFSDTDGFADGGGCFGGAMAYGIYGSWVMISMHSGLRYKAIQKATSWMDLLWLISEKTIAVSHSHQILQWFTPKMP